jgi:hypothetical protein
MQNGILGNASTGYVDQRLRDSPLHKLKTCTKSIQNPTIPKVSEKKEVQPGNHSESD